MKLILTKDQSKGMMCGVSFEVKAQVQLSEEEKKLIQHYKLEKEILFHKKMVSIWGQPTDVEISVRVANIINGEVYKCKSLDEVISYSDSLKEACETLKSYLDVAKSFGGDEVFEI